MPDSEGVIMLREAFEFLSTHVFKWNVLASGIGGSMAVTMFTSSVRLRNAIKRGYYYSTHNSYERNDDLKAVNTFWWSTLIFLITFGLSVALKIVEK